MSFFVFSGTLMLQLDGFPTGDGVKVKIFIHINQSILTPTQGCGVVFAFFNPGTFRLAV